MGDRLVEEELILNELHLDETKESFDFLRPGPEETLYEAVANELEIKAQNIVNNFNTGAFKHEPLFNTRQEPNVQIN